MKRIPVVQRNVALRQNPNVAFGSTVILNVLHLAPFFFRMACKQNLDLRCILISDPGTLGAGARTRLESRIKTFTSHASRFLCAAVLQLQRSVPSCVFAMGKSRRPDLE